MTIEESEKEIIEEFELFGDDWEAKYQHMIDMGKSLPKLDEKYKTDNNLIKGCQSRVWLHSEFAGGRMIYRADSDAIITRGMVAMLVRVLNNEKPEDVVKADMTFIDSIGLKEHLSPTRANGLVSMVTRMKQDALLRIRGSS
jgi:cysteine desulfuration protein SufE